MQLPQPNTPVYVSEKVEKVKLGHRTVWIYGDIKVTPIRSSVGKRNILYYQVSRRFGRFWSDIELCAGIRPDSRTHAKAPGVETISSYLKTQGIAVTQKAVVNENKEPTNVRSAIGNNHHGAQLLMTGL